MGEIASRTPARGVPTIHEVVPARGRPQGHANKRRVNAGTRPPPHPKDVRKGAPNRRQVSVLCGGSAPPQGDRKGPIPSSSPHPPLQRLRRKMSGSVSL